MVRTKAGSVSTKAIGAKAPGKVAITTVLSGNTPKVRSHGNPYHPRETPGWQKPITFFMKQDADSSKNDADKEPAGKRMKIIAGSSRNYYIDKETEEQDGIPGISDKLSRKNKDNQDMDFDMDIDKEFEETKKISKGKGKLKGQNSDKKKNKIDDSDSKVKEKGKHDAENDKNMEKPENEKVTEDTSDDGKAMNIENNVKVKEVQKANNDTETDEMIEENNQEEAKRNSVNEADKEKNNDKDPSKHNEENKGTKDNIIDQEKNDKGSSQNRVKSESPNYIKSKVVEEENKENDPQNEEIITRE